MRLCVRTVLILRARLVRLGQGKTVFVLWIVPVPMCQDNVMSITCSCAYRQMTAVYQWRNAIVTAPLLLLDFEGTRHCTHRNTHHYGENCTIMITRLKERKKDAIGAAKALTVVVQRLERNTAWEAEVSAKPIADVVFRTVDLCKDFREHRRVTKVGKFWSCAHVSDDRAFASD